MEIHLTEKEQEQLKVPLTEEEQNRLNLFSNNYGAASTIEDRNIAVEYVKKLEEDISKRVGQKISVFVGLPVVLTGLPEILSLIEVDNPVIGELGAWTGFSTRIIGDWIKKNGSGTQIVVEWFKGSPGVIEKDFRELFFDNTKEYKYYLIEKESGEAAKGIPDDKLDFFFIDADHRYHMIKRDLDLWYPKVKKGGILAGHDYDTEEYEERYIEQDIHENIHHGVTKAVNERFGIPNHENHIWWIRK